MSGKLHLTIILMAAAVLNFAGARAENVIGESLSSNLTVLNTSSWKNVDEPEMSIRAVLDAQQAAWNRGDIPGFLEGYWNSPELTFAGSEGIVRGHDGLMARYRKSYPDKEAMGELDFSGLEIRSLGPEAALVLGHWHLKRKTGDVGGVFSLVFERISGNWRIIHDHTSAQKRTP